MNGLAKPGALGLVALLMGAQLGCQNPVKQAEAPASPPPGYAPVGTAEDRAYAGKLWAAMARARLVGPEARPLEPFFGGAKPHGTILEVTSQMMTLAEHRGFLVVKKNYEGPGVSAAAVDEDRARYLESITVMYRREAGYDEANQNWFWVKYRPDGGLFEKPIHGRPTTMAGRLVKGPTQDQSGGCIYCHASAGGGDYVFYPEIEVPDWR